jgi:ankyrin repeat protein
VTALHAAAHCCENSLKHRRYSSEQDIGGEKAAEKSLVKQRHVDIVRMLCKAGARINCKDSKNLTPLHYACRSNSEVSRLLFVCLVVVQSEWLWL